MMNSTIHGLGQFLSGRSMRTFELDKQQQIQCNFIFYLREVSLSNQLKSVCLPIPFLGWIAPSIAACKLGLFVAQQAVDKRSYEALNIASSCLDSILDNGDALFNVALTVSYTAMIAFGHPVSGTIGLAFLALTFLKMNNLLPQILEKPLLPLRVFTNLWESYRFKNPLFFAVNLTGDLVMLANYLERQFPSTVTLPPGEHIKKNIPDSLEHLVLNKTSLHALEPGEILSKELLEELEEVSSEELYERIESLNIPCNQEGWGKIKGALLHGTATGEIPLHFTTFCNVLKAFLLKINKEQDPIIKSNAIKDLALLGISCTDGWTRDIGVMLEPKSNDIAWCIHTTLAKYRQDLILKRLLLQEERFPRFFAAAGGVNNIHLHKQLAKSLWHKWRTDLGETSFALDGRPFALRLLQSSFVNDEIKKAIIPGLFLEPSTLCLTPLLPLIDYYLEDKYNASFIQDKIFDAIKPTYPEVNGQKEILRVINWEPIASWLAKRQEEAGDILDEADEYNTRWVTRDEENQLHLTREGVRLLLADIGVLERYSS
jgi:hypothetical protein